MNEQQAIEHLYNTLSAYKERCNSEWSNKDREAFEALKVEVEKQEKYKWHDLRKDPDDLPEEHDSIFAKFKNTSKWHSSMFEKTSDEVQVCFQFEDGTRIVKQRTTLDGKFVFEHSLLNTSMNPKAIAWREIEPYEEGDADDNKRK